MSARQGVYKMPQAFIMVTGERAYREVDAILYDATEAEAHQRMLREELGCDVTVYLVEGPEAPRHAEDVADELRECKAFGRKAFARYSVDGHKVGVAKFSRSVMATFG